jgi:hypothetical protein
MGRGTRHLLGVVAVAILLVAGVGSARAGDTDSIGLSINVVGSETPEPSETPTASETPVPTGAPTGEQDKTTTSVKSLPNTGDGPAGTSPVAVLTLVSVAGVAFLASAMLVRRRPTG